jgi:Leucine-rich repeat (LRR) protein
MLNDNSITCFENDSFVSKGLVELNLIQADRCKIRKIEMRAFNMLIYLAYLSLEGNYISDIIPGTFDMTSHLEHLNLNNNEIEHLESDVFRGLIKLQYIDLQRNMLKYLHPDTFQSLTNLQRLYLSKNSGLQIPTDHNPIISRSLKILGISGCNIRSVSVNTFANVSALQWLDLSYNYLLILDMNILKVLPKLSVLNLTHNEIKEIIPGIFEKFNSLEYLYLDHNIIEHLRRNTFYGMINLKHVGLQGNKLQYLHPDTFLGIPNFQGLYLSKNPEIKVPNNVQFISSHSLKRLGVSGCKVSSMSIETFANVSELEWLDLSYNYLSILNMNTLKLLPKLTALNLTRNQISEIMPGKFETFSNLEYLHLDYNKIEVLGSDVLNWFVKLIFIDLQGNKLQNLHPHTFTKLPNLQHLYLSENADLQIPTDRQFINSLSLKHLLISGCNILSVSVETFANVSALDGLDLSYNYWAILDMNILRVLPKLSVLDLTHNEISEIIQGKFEKLSLLEYLYLDHNIIEHLRIDVFYGLVELKHVGLQGNKLQYLHPDTFFGLPILQSLNLSQNTDLQVPTDRQFINSHSLKFFDISGCNISSVSVETFTNVSALEWLDLSSNYLDIIDMNILKVLPNLSKISLTRNTISELIPGTFEEFSSLKYLHLDYNVIKHLDIDVFNGLVNIIFITLHGNKMKHLHPDTFVELPNMHGLSLSRDRRLRIPTDRQFINHHSLKHLFISGCKIRSVSVETFANVSALEFLDLSYNRLAVIDMNILKVLPKLSTLNLTHNKISVIIPGTFEKFSNLEYLFIDYNRIEYMISDTFAGLFNLIQVSLQGNNLHYLQPDTFLRLQHFRSLLLSGNSDLHVPTDRQLIKSHSLKRLGIGGCNVTSVSVDTFSNVSALEWLDLGNNYLRILDKSVLKSLRSLSMLNLHENPLECDCQLQEVWRWCQDHNIQTAYKEIVPICDTPSEVMGMWWGVLEKGQCLQGNVQYYGNYKNTSYNDTPIKDIVEDTNMVRDTEDRVRITIKSVAKQYELPVSTVLFIIGTTGNVMLIIIIICNKDMRNIPNMYILNLAISDIIYLTVLLLDDLRSRIFTFWLDGEIVCAFFAFCNRTSVGLTAYSVTLISFQRYRVIVNPLHAHTSSQPTWRGAGAIICGVWIVAALFAIPEARSPVLCGSSVLLFLKDYYKRVVLFQLLVSCIFPLCVIAFSYIMTACHLLKRADPMFAETQNAQLNTRTNTAKIVLGLIVIFLISYVPYHIWMICFIYSINLNNFFAELDVELVWATKLFDIMPILNLFLLINPCLNPIALFCTSTAFRRHFKHYLTCCCKTKSTSTEFELAKRK